MKLKRTMIILLCVAVLLVGCSSGGTNESAGTSGTTGDSAQDAEKIVFAMWTINTLPTEDAIQAVEDEINKITIDKIGVEVELQIYPVGEYSQKVALELQSGGQIDAFCCVQNFQSIVSDDMCYDITDLIEANCPDVMELIPEDWWSCATLDGKVYALPIWIPSASGLTFTWRSDIAEELNIDMDKVNSVEDLTEVFETVKETYPEMYLLIGGNAGFGGYTGMTYAIPGVDTMGDNRVLPAGVLMEGSDTVVNLFETEEYAEQMALVREWYEKGYIMQDLATTTLTNVEIIAGGNAFGNITGQGGAADYVASNASNQTGQPLATKYISDVSIDTSNITNQALCIASTSKVPEAALKFLNLTYCDADIANLLQWGIEGRDYVVNADGTVQPPEGFDSSSVPYPGGYMDYGNMYTGLEYPAVGTTQESIAWGTENNRTAARSASFGFVFDPSNVTNQYATVNNVIMQYYSGLDCGSVDPETTIPQFNQALKDAGIDDIIAEKQAQYDEWRAAQ